MVSSGRKKTKSVLMHRTKTKRPLRSVDRSLAARESTANGTNPKSTASTKSDPTKRFVINKDVKHFHHFETPKAVASAAILELLSAVFNVANVYVFRNNWFEVVLTCMWHFALWILPLRLLHPDRDRTSVWNKLVVYLWIAVVLGMPYVKVARVDAPWVGAVHGAASVMTTIRFLQMWNDPATFANWGPFMRFYSTSAWCVYYVVLR